MQLHPSHPSNRCSVRPHRCPGKRMNPSWGTNGGVARSPFRPPCPLPSPLSLLIACFSLTAPSLRHVQLASLGHDPAHFTAAVYRRRYDAGNLYPSESRHVTGNCKSMRKERIPSAGKLWRIKVSLPCGACMPESDSTSSSLWRQAIYYLPGLGCLAGGLSRVNQSSPSYWSNNKPACLVGAPRVWGLLGSVNPAMLYCW